jgi:hypothetical protein
LFGTSIRPPRCALTMSGGRPPHRARVSIVSDAVNLPPLTHYQNSQHAPALAEVIRRLLRPTVFAQLDPWLPFPQNACSFRFGRASRPLPIGALRILWDEGAPFSQPCPECGDMARMISFGGLLSVGGGRLICTGCSGDFFQHIGGLSSVQMLVASTSLRSTEFNPSSFVFGGSVGSDGGALLKLLGLPPLPMQREEGVVRLETNARVRLAFGSEPSQEAGGASPSTRNAPTRSLREYMRSVVRFMTRQ